MRRFGCAAAAALVTCTASMGTASAEETTRSDAEIETALEHRDEAKRATMDAEARDERARMDASASAARKAAAERAADDAWTADVAAGSEGRDARRLIGWTLLGTGALITTIGVGLYGSAASTRSDVVAGGLSSSDLGKAESTISSNSKMGVGFLIWGGAMLATGGVLLYTAKEPRRAAPKVGVHLGPGGLSW